MSKSISVSGLLLAASVFTLSALAQDIPTLDPEDAHRKVQRGELVLIDVRTPEEWAETGVPRDAHTADFSAAGFIAKARGAALGDLEQPIAVICRSGNRSAEAAAALADAGFSSVYEVTAGMQGNADLTRGWLAAGLPTDGFILAN